MTSQTMRHLMVDCETLGLAVDAGVWQLAIREFTIDPVAGVSFVEGGLELNALIDQVTVSDNVKAGRQSMDWSTILWLEKQEAAPLFKHWARLTHGLFHFDTIMVYDESNRSYVLDENCAGCSVGFVLDTLQTFEAMEDSEVHYWSKGKEFDKPILENMFKASGLKAPWKYYNFHCVRDAFALPYLLRGENPPRRKAKTHNAWDDCAEQLGLLNETFNVSKG